MPIRIVSWNCADYFDRKAARLAEFAADIVVVPEVRQRHAEALGEHYSFIWDGAADQRGLLVAAAKPWRLEVLHRASARHMTLVKASREDEELFMVGVWAMLGPKRYVGSLVSGLEELPQLPSDAAVIVAGDFNASPVFDRQYSSAGHFREVTKRLDAMGLHSLWHSARNEAFGAELQPTYFHQWKREQPFHIDFMFASEALRGRLHSFELGAFEHWCPSASDHMPLIADFR